MSRPSGFGGRGQGASRRFARACPREGGGPDPARGSRGAGRTNDTRGSAIAVAVDLQERATAGAGAAGAGPPSEPHPGGRIAQCGGYSLQANCKTTEGDSHPDRDAQFARINTQVAAALAEKQPVISVDTKKKELVGDFRNNGPSARYRL